MLTVGAQRCWPPARPAPPRGTHGVVVDADEAVDGEEEVLTRRGDLRALAEPPDPAARAHLRRVGVDDFARGHRLAHGLAHGREDVALAGDADHEVALKAVEVVGADGHPVAKADGVPQVDGRR